MVTLNKIYTKTGDKGSTALGSGERVPKQSLRISAYGTVDETNSCVGLARLHTGGALDEALARVQNDLFDLGADLCVPAKSEKEGGEPLDYEPLRMSEPQVARLEAEMDEWTKKLQPLKSFILPGGTPAAAFLHQARAVSRRAERLMVELAAEEGEVVSDEALRYINRLSDHLFVAARWANDEGRGDVLWVPGANR